MGAMKTRGADDAGAPEHASRRGVLLGVGAATGLVALATPRAAFATAAKHGKGEKKGEEAEQEGIAPGEDLMREHGVLRRVLLVYGELGRRLDAGGQIDPGALREGATIIRTFIEDYHERQEEDFLFPRFERANKLRDLVRVLREQHQAGRKLTERILAAASQAALSNPANKRGLRADLAAFIAMYEPHAAREDTVLFPALHELVSRSELDAMGEDFERRERTTLGSEGFERMVARVDAVERSLGIEDLGRFTPRA
jgi:hemerythrin-like domain-containing protein